MAIAFQNFSDHSAFEAIIARLSPYATLLDNLCNERNIFALVAIGSIPGGYARPESDLDILAFVAPPTTPQRAHYLDGKKIYLRELSIAQSRKELEVCPTISLLPMALVVLPFAVVYVHPEYLNEFWSALAELQARAVQFVLRRVEGEICFGLLASKMDCQHILVTAAGIAGYHLMFSAIFNPQLSGKLGRLRANFNQRDDLLLQMHDLPSGWSVTNTGISFYPYARNKVISYAHFVWDAIQASLYWHHTPRHIKRLTFRQIWQHHISEARQISEPLCMYSTPVSRLPRLLMLTYRAARNPEIRHSYGRLSLSSRGWNYAGIGSLITSRENL